MGRPKLKTIETAIDLDKVKLPDELSVDRPEELALSLDEKAEEVLEQKTKERLAVNKKTAKSVKAKKVKTRSKKYLEAQKNLEKDSTYPIVEAIEILKKLSYSKFDGSVEAHLNLRVDSAKQEQQIRTTTSLPHGNGKKLRVLVFGAKNNAALKEIGAFVGTDETIEQIQKSKIEFDNSSGTRITKLEEINKIVASPDWMPKLAKVAKVLGPKGLMPNPKSGTVSTEPEKTAAELSRGLVEIKTENSPIIHLAVGKVSFKTKELEENITSLIEAVKNAKPAEVKKELIKNIYLTTTMSPSVKLDLTSPEKN